SDDDILDTVVLGLGESRPSHSHRDQDGSRKHRPRELRIDAVIRSRHGFPPSFVRVGNSIARAVASIQTIAALACRPIWVRPETGTHAPRASALHAIGGGDSEQSEPARE